MAGSRPAHLARRGAVYQVRFRLPADLAISIGMAEFRRSLHTSNYQTARALCLKATVWFTSEIERLRAMAHPTRSDLEAAARAYFEAEADKQGQLRYSKDRLEEADYQVELSRQIVGEMDDDLVSNDYSGHAHQAAMQMLRAMDADLETLPDKERLIALNLGARAVRELSLRLIHRLTDPAGRYEPHDPHFGVRGTGPLAAREERAISGTDWTVERAIEAFADHQRRRRLSASTTSETARVLGYLSDRFGPGARLSSLTADDIKVLRNDLTRLDGRLQGRQKPFEQRLTDRADAQIGYATYIKYWRALRQFFKWAVEERMISDDPSDVAAPPKPKGLKTRSPDPFTPEELKRLFATPLYSGHKSPKQVKVAGACHRRGGHWWSGVLLLYTGLRGGELAQLTPEDFTLEAAIPYLTVTDEGEADGKAKQVKTATSVRQVPIHPDLLALGLAEFVAGGRKRGKSTRLFEVFATGRNRSSAGITRYWGDYLKKFGLWSEGRSTHVFRHTLIGRLRLNGALDEEIAPIVGHSSGGFASLGQTKAYGGEYPLERKLATISKLDYGIDVVDALGGTYDPSKHR